VRHGGKPYTTRLAVSLLFTGFVFGSFYFSRDVSAVAGSEIGSESFIGIPEMAKVRYSSFSHSLKAHQMDCAKCHKFPSDNWNKVRTGDDAFPDVTAYPKHDSCLDCHRRQFFRGAKPPICTICHVNSFPPRDSTRWPFYNPREVFDLSPKGKTAESDFAVKFPHDKHADIVSRIEPRVRFVDAAYVRAPRKLAEESCSVCHQTYKPQGDSADEYMTKPPDALGDGFWLKKGTFKTAPIGHAKCFTCHSADSGLSPAPTDCSVCHTLKLPEPKTDFDAKLFTKMRVDDKIIRSSWIRRQSSSTFRHEFSSHSDLECSTCHTIATINTADPATQKVSISSCSICHVTGTVDDGGAVNFEVDARKKDAKFECVKCHVAFGKLPIPESHLKVLAEAK